MKIGFWGAGKMAEGILAAALKAGIAPQDVTMAEKSPSRAAELAQKYGVNITDNCRIAAKDANIVFLAVRPQDVASVAQEAAGALAKDTTLVSIVAGKTLSSLEKDFKFANIVRVMPNLALRAGEGASAYTRTTNPLVAKILSAAGQAVELDECHFDAVTALSGSGPAFFAFMEQAMTEGGVALGLPEASARLLAEQTMLGTAAFLRNSRMDLGEFIGGVATKGGTTAAGMEVLGASAFKRIVADTLAAAAARSAALGK